MHAHRLRVHVSPDHEVALRLPDDFPTGPAEVIVLADAKAPRTAGQRLSGPHPVLGKITFHDDPALPLDPDDWPEE